MQKSASQGLKILITGATGYVGGRLLKTLQIKNHSLRCLARRPEFLLHEKSESTEVVPGNLLDFNSVKSALDGIDIAYYLVHALGSTGSFEEEEYRAAKIFSKACQESGVRQIIYLGGLGTNKESLSEHLRTRQEVGDLLRSSGIPVIEFRASIILGSGSFSFEMIRSLVERLPIMTTPKWVKTLAQPIAIEDVIAYLVDALTIIPVNKIFEIGGSDIVSYLDLMKEYSKQRGLKRWMIPLPFLTPYLSSLWLSLITPLFARVGRRLIEGIRNTTLVENKEALLCFPIKPMGMKEAIVRSLENEDQEFAQTHWSDSTGSREFSQSWGGRRFKNRFIETHQIDLLLPTQMAFIPIQKIGGKTGWYYANFLWRIRGFIDRMIGGVGLRRGRRDPNHLTVGDALDFWRV
ncbi:MAG: DUF2867 domain-containing protein, partial [Deltaproteobacteria bacterium]|nr:DUF2867 domain-containing protein [Deltaproteobacteria bacterium]